MAEAEENGTFEEEDEQQQHDLTAKLTTVELNSGEQSPVLRFHQEEEEAEQQQNGEGSSNPPATADTNCSPSVDTPQVVATSVDGTQLQARGNVTKVLTSTTSNIKEWSFFQYKVTKQVLSERFGKSLRTVDASLESRLEAIKDTQRKYQHLMSLSGQLQVHMEKVVETQKALAEHFAFLSVRCPELDAEFEFNSDTHKKIARNGDTLVSSLQFFISNLYTLSSKSIEDTLTTAKQYETTRILFDAYRSDLEAVTKAAKTSQAAANKLSSVQAEYDKQKDAYEKLRYNLDIKLKLLDENRFKVMQRQLVLLHSAFAAYFSGNHVVMETLIKEFQDKLESKKHQRNDPPTWLEDLPSDEGAGQQ